MQKAELNQKVEYVGVGRPHLLNRRGNVTNTKLDGRSALVYFDGTLSEVSTSEWIGVSALKLWDDSGDKSYSIKSLQGSLTELDEEYKSLRARLVNVESKRQDLRAAISALKTLGSA